MTLLIISILIFSLFALVVHISRNSPFFCVESAIVGDTNSIEEKDIFEKFPEKIRVKRNVVFETPIHRFRLKENVSLVIATDSVEPANIKKGDLILLETKINPFNLKKGDIVAIKIVNNNLLANKIKLRLFDHIQKENDSFKISVKKYNTHNQLVDSDRYCVEKNIVGKCVAIFSNEELQKILY